MDIRNAGFDRYEKATLHNPVEEGDRVWLPEDFEDDIPDVRVHLDTEERTALYAGVIVHDRRNPDRAVLDQLSTFARLELVTGGGRERGFSVRVNEFTEYELLRAAAWAARNAAHEVSGTVLEVVGVTPPDVLHPEQLQDAAGLLSRMVTQLEAAGVIPIEKPEGGA